MSTLPRIMGIIATTVNARDVPNNVCDKRTPMKPTTPAMKVAKLVVRQNVPKRA